MDTYGQDCVGGMASDGRAVVWCGEGWQSGGGIGVGWGW